MEACKYEIGKKIEDFFEKFKNAPHSLLWLWLLLRVKATTHLRDFQCFCIGSDIRLLDIPCCDDRLSHPSMLTYLFLAVSWLWLSLVMANSQGAS